MVRDYVERPLARKLPLHQGSCSYAPCMIRHPLTGDPFETAAELTARWSDVSRAMLDDWAARKGVRKTRLVDDNGRPQVVWHLGDAATQEAKPRTGGRGRPRGQLTAARS